MMGKLFIIIVGASAAALLWSCIFFVIVKVARDPTIKKIGVIIDKKIDDAYQEAVKP